MPKPVNTTLRKKCLTIITEETGHNKGLDVVGKEVNVPSNYGITMKSDIR